MGRLAFKMSGSGWHWLCNAWEKVIVVSTGLITGGNECQWVFSNWR